MANANALILVVDDDPTIRKLLSDVLKLSGFRVAGNERRLR
jgi:CheY-like chemotaxis protein